MTFDASIAAVSWVGLGTDFRSLKSVLPSANLENTSPATLREILRPFAGKIKYLDIDTEID